MGGSSGSAPERPFDPEMVLAAIERYASTARPASNGRFSNGAFGLLWQVLTHPNTFPAFIAIVLLGVFLGLLPSPITRTEAMLALHIEGEGQRTALMRVLCRHQAMALKQNPDECDLLPRR